MRSEFHNAKGKNEKFNQPAATSRSERGYFSSLLEGALASVQRLLVAARTPVQHVGAALQVSASAGVSLYPQGPEVDAEQLMRQADQAMYQAKKQGKDGYQVFDAARELHERGQIEGQARVRLALQRGELVLHYQPKVDMQRGQVLGAEALLRWQHPERGLLSPSAFLPLIEGQALSIDVGHWVIEQALAQMADWRAQDLALPVSVNVGALELQDSALVPYLRAALQRNAQVPAGDLQLEILETRALDDLARVSETMAECHALGVRHALDDFGTGYASLSYFKRLPVDELKIDQSFVRDMLDDPDDLAILTGILNLARAFERRVIAEGVESEATGRLLIQLGCTRAQGYAIARPMPAAELLDWVRNWRSPVAWTQAKTLPAVHHAVLVMAVELRAWVGALQAYLSGVRKTPPQLDTLRCNLGQWLSHIDPAWRAWPCVQGLPALHEGLHALAADLVAGGVQAQVLQSHAWAQVLTAREAVGLALDELAQRVADQAR